MRLAFDDVKQHEGRPYTGLRVGAAHEWRYVGEWSETKLTPDAYRVRFAATKTRRHEAPAGSGAEVGSAYHWFLVAHQRVRKIDANAYETLMEGTKWRVAHKRPHWRAWSSEYPEQASARKKVIGILEGALTQLRSDETCGVPSLEKLLDPAILVPALAGPKSRMP